MTLGASTRVLLTHVGGVRVLHGGGTGDAATEVLGNVMHNPTAAYQHIPV